MTSHDRFQIQVFGRPRGAATRDMLGTAGALIALDFYAPIYRATGGAVFLPGHIGGYNTALPALPTFGPPSEGVHLDRVLAEFPQLCSAGLTYDRLVLCPAGKHFQIDLLRVDDRRTGKTRILLAVEGTTLHFVHRGRHVQADLASSSGRQVLFVARWNPSSISLEVQGGGVAPDARSLMISHGDVGRPQLMLRHVSDGDDATLPADEPIHTASWCIGIVALVRRGTSRSQLEPFVRLLVGEATTVFQDFIASADMPGMRPGDHVAFMAHVLPVEVDDVRFERWRVALGRPPDWSGECEVAFLRHPLAKATTDSALSVLACTFASQLDRMVGGCGDLPPTLPEAFVDAADAVQWFWFHACSSHFFIDDISTALKSELETKIHARQRAEVPVILQAAPLGALFDAAGREWLRTRLARRTKKANATQRPLARAFGPDPAQNTAVAAFGAFQNDRSVARLVESAQTLDLWMHAAKLSADVDELLRRLPATDLAGVEARLRSAGDAAPKAEFELEVLAELLRREHAAAFLAPANESQKRTPDIIITSACGPVYVECSHKDEEPEHVAVARSHAQQLVQYLHSQGEKRKRSLLLDLRFLDRPQSKHLDEILALLRRAVATAEPICSTPEDSTEWTVSVRDLGERRRVWRMDALYGVVPDASWVYATGQWYDGWSVRNHVCHATAVAVSLDTSRRLLKTVENTLRDKARYTSKGGQLPDGSPAVCAISLGTVTDDAASEVVTGASRLVTNFSALSALVLFWSKRIAADLVPTARGWRAHVVTNPQARVPLPAGFDLPNGILAMTGLMDKPPP